MIKETIIQTKPNQVKIFIREQLGKNLHAKQIESLVNGVLGVLESSSLKPSKIGEGLAAIRGILPKHGIKQVDCYFSNSFFFMHEFFYNTNYANLVIAESTSPKQ